MKTEDILATIDHALEDWEVSGDAMRWTPDPPSRRIAITPPQQGTPLFFHWPNGRVDEIDSP